jgi:hypothetical protein
MNQKLAITKFIIDHLSLPSDEKNFKKYLFLWWRSIRVKDSGGLGLSEEGFNALCKCDIKKYKINFPKNIICNNNLILILDQNLKSPYFITKNHIYVFNETTAIHLILLDGDLHKFTTHVKKLLDS